MQQILQKTPSIFYYRIALLLVCLMSVGVIQAQLIQNGNFTSGNIYINSEYNYFPPSKDILYTEGRYTITNDPNSIHSGFCTIASILSASLGIAPPSGGNMLIGNGYPDDSKKLWAQTVNLTTNTNYTLTFYAMSLADPDGSLKFGLYANCTRLGQDIDVYNKCIWRKYTINFNSGVLTSLELSLRNISVNKNGNDIAIDDIVLVKTSPVPATDYDKISDDFVWHGYDTDWTNADNWGSCTVPTCADDVIIPAGITNYPVLASGTVGNVRSLTIESGAKVTLNSTSELQVCGHLLNSGNIAANSSALITMMGTADQNISGGTYINLKINKNSGYVIPLATISISGTLNLTKGLIKTNSYEVNVTNSASGAITNFSSTSYVYGNLRRAIDAMDVPVPNYSFESYGWAAIPTNWTVANTYSYVNTTGAYTGNVRLIHYRATGSGSSTYDAVTYQTLTGLTNGTYKLTAWIKADAGQSDIVMYASNYGGSQIETAIPSASNWTQITLSNIVVTNGQCRIGFESNNSPRGKSLQVDNVEFTKTDAIDYDYPIGDAGKYERLKMTVTSDLNVNSVLGFFTWGAPGGTSLPTGTSTLKENTNDFKYLAGDGYWTLTPNVTPTGSPKYNLTLYLPVYPSGSGPVTFAKRTDSSSPWGFNNSTVFPANDYTIKLQYQRNGFTGFSQIGLISGTPVSLPVEYLSFNGYATDHKQVQLKWTTSSEKNSDVFYIERSLDGKSYTRIGSVDATGSSKSVVAYSFLDTNPGSGTNYYRLNQLDLDGSSSYSKVITVKLGNSDNPYSFVFYPNPSDGKDVFIQTDYAGQATLHIYTIQGVSVCTQTIELDGTGTSVALPGLSAGAYVITISTPSQVSHQKLIIK